MRVVALLAASLLVAVYSGLVVADEFRCLDGAKASRPYQPGDVVRWCEIWKDGRLLYHGSVWRWYRSGHMEGKEFYVYGNAEGEWPSWYENGKPSSIGTFKNGSKVGLWKYWDEAGWLKTELTYTDAGNFWTEYYPTGRKKATGRSAPSGKIGIWTYWDNGGKEKARCDFENGLFKLPTDACRLIANELEPKGFSPPIAVATITPDGNAVIRIAADEYEFEVPEGWIADTKSGKRERLPIVFYPKGGSWRGHGPNMYVRVLYKKGASFVNVVKNEAEEFQQNVAQYAEESEKRVRLSTGRTDFARIINYKPLVQTDSPFAIVSANTIHESVHYLDASDNVVLMVVLTSNEKQQLKNATSALMSLVESFWDKDTRAGSEEGRARRGLKQQ